MVIGGTNDQGRELRFANERARRSPSRGRQPIDRRRASAARCFTGLKTLASSSESMDNFAQVPDDVFGICWLLAPIKLQGIPASFARRLDIVLATVADHQQR